LSEGKITEASKLLNEIQAVQYRPATVATLIALYELDDHASSAVSKLYDDAINYWVNKKNDKLADVNARSCLMVIGEKAAAFHVRQKSFNTAVNIYKRLLSEIKDDITRDKEYYQRLIANLTLAAARDSQEQLQQYMKDLPTIDGQSKVDVNALESGTAPAAAKKIQKPAKEKKDEKEVKEVKEVKEKKDAAASAAAKKKKKRTPRLPKNFDAKNPGPLPDPERWLPRWQRKSAQKGRRRKNLGGRTGQGVALSEAEIKSTSSSLPAPVETHESERSVSAAEKAAMRKRKGNKAKGSKNLV